MPKTKRWKMLPEHDTSIQPYLPTNTKLSDNNIKLSYKGYFAFFMCMGEICCVLLM